MCGLTADFSNVKRWATYDLCGEPPVLSHSPPTASMDMLSQSEDRPLSSAVEKWTPLFDRLRFVVGRCGYNPPPQKKKTAGAGFLSLFPVNQNLKRWKICCCVLMRRRAATDVVQFLSCNVQ